MLDKWLCVLNCLLYTGFYPYLLITLSAGYKIPVIENLGATLVSRNCCSLFIFLIYKFYYFINDNVEQECVTGSGKMNSNNVGYFRSFSEVSLKGCFWATAACFQDQFDTLELSDNDIRKLDGFPLLRRLKCLVLNNNRVSLVSELLCS